MRGEQTLKLFTAAMQRELDANEDKGDWIAGDWHYAELRYHCHKLRAAVAAGEPLERVLEFSADVANHAMFLAHAAGALEHEVVMSRAEEPSYMRLRGRTYLRIFAGSPRYWRSFMSCVRGPAYKT